MTNDADLFFDPSTEWIMTRRDRPHWKQEGKVQFVTWRQADSLARVTLDALRDQRRIWLRQRGCTDAEELTALQRDLYDRLFHARTDRWLQAGAGSCVLKHAVPRAILHKALLYFDGTRYALGSFAIAANHVHVLVRPERGYDLSSITHSWKSFTSKAINNALGRSGKLWRTESFDHIVRNEASLERIEAYILDHARQGALVERRPFE